MTRAILLCLLLCSSANAALYPVVVHSQQCSPIGCSPVPAAEGTGIAIAHTQSGGTIVLTAAHVIKRPTGGRVSVVVHGRAYPVDVAYTSSNDSDVAALYYRNRLQLTALDVTPCRTGIPVYISGLIRGRGQTYDGRVASCEGGWLNVEGYVQQGMSGGAIMSDKGVIGIISGYETNNPRAVVAASQREIFRAYHACKQRYGSLHTERIESPDVQPKPTPTIEKGCDCSGQFDALTRRLEALEARPELTIQEVRSAINLHLQMAGVLSMDERLEALEAAFEDMHDQTISVNDVAAYLIEHYPDQLRGPKGDKGDKGDKGPAGPAIDLADIQAAITKIESRRNAFLLLGDPARNPGKPVITDKNNQERAVVSETIYGPDDAVVLDLSVIRKQLEAE